MMPPIIPNVAPIPPITPPVPSSTPSLLSPKTTNTEIKKEDIPTPSHPKNTFTIVSSDGNLSNTESVNMEVDMEEDNYYTEFYASM